MTNELPVHLVKQHIDSFCRQINRAKNRAELDKARREHMPYIPEHLHDECRRLYDKRLDQVGG